MSDLDHTINGKINFNSLTIEARIPIPGRAQFRCRCVCGTMVIVRGDKLTSGGTKSCGKCPANPTRPRTPQATDSRPTSDPAKNRDKQARPVLGPMAESLAVGARRGGMTWDEIADLITPAGCGIPCTVAEAKALVARAQDKEGVA